MCFDNDRVDPGTDQGRGLFEVRGVDVVASEIAVRLHHAAKRPEVAEDKAVAVAQGLAGDPRRGLIDPRDIHVGRVAVEHQPRGTKGIRDQTVGARFDAA